MALFGRVGTGQEVHQIGMALFENGRAEGHSICGIEGDVSLVMTAVPNCQKCRDRKIKNEMGRLMGQNTKGSKTRHENYAHENSHREVLDDI